MNIFPGDHGDQDLYWKCAIRVLERSRSGVTNNYSCEKANSILSHKHLKLSLPAFG